MEEQRKEKSVRPKSRQSIAHMPSKANMTTDIAALKRAEEAKDKAKRSRGKSLGPGGLEALTETNANVFKIPPMFQPKSILKPAVPLTPPKVIPSFDELRKKDTGKAKSPAKNGAEDLLIDFSTPGPSRDSGSGSFMPGTENLVDPFSPIRPQSKDDVEQHQEAGDEEEQRRQDHKKAVVEQRAARRKSLANRRVSFAPEATLHTWSVMELVEDSTTSSASNSTRRQSAMTAAQSPMPDVSTPGTEGERPSTPVEQHNDEVVKDSPDSQRELHQRKRRRTSDITSTSEDETFSSPGDEGDSSPIRVEDSIDSESDTDGDTAMSLDEATQNTVRSSDSSSTQTSLDERLRKAASQAGTKGIDYDEHGPGAEQNDDEGEDQSMEIADGTVTHAFRQYARKDNGHSQETTNDADKENFNHIQHQSMIASEQEDEEPEEDDATMGMTMDMTRAVGGIVPNGVAKQAKNTPNRRRSNFSRHSSSGADSSYGEETMDMTVAKGGILSNGDDEEDADEQFTDEEMTMEMTKGVGGIRNPAKRQSLPSIMTEETESMDMTMAAGGILPPIEEQTEPQSLVEGDLTRTMDITRAVGKILPQQAREDVDESMAQAELEQESPSAQLNQEINQFVTAPASTTRAMATIASETGSPTLKPRLSARRTAPNSRSTTPGSGTKMLSPQAVGQTTPSKQVTPLPAKSTSPKRTPVLAANVTTRGASPKKLFAKEIRQRASPARKSPRKEHDLLFSKDETTGMHTPKVVLHAPKPHQHLRRRSSGVGIDSEGTGSPRVSEILSRRESIGEGAPNFQLQKGLKKQIQFDDPRQIEHEIDAERAEEHRRESGRFIMEQEASEQQEENTTQNLKDMIESMTPKKDKKAVKTKGRKSLAVGSARGLLGKRPAELDDDDDEDSTPKRLKTVSREASPVKKVHLPKPPTKEETTGRLSRAEQLMLETVAQPNHTPTLAQSPARKAKTPGHTGRFRNPPSTQKPASFEERLDNVVGATDIATMHPEAAEDVAEEEKISLQQFLNMTNVHFIELSTTKRRHTMAQSTIDAEDGDADGTSQASFVAAATTLPLLELYQHATRELKSYISSGRKIIRQIEAEALAEQPAIFKKYVDARPEAKAVMDNQFRNAKTSARYQSKEGWYTWRGQLVDGLQSGLEGIKTDMEKDKHILSNQQYALDSVVPQFTLKKQQLDQQLQDLRRRLDESESFDHGALKEKREELSAVDTEVTRQSQHLAALQRELQEKDEVLSSAAELRQEMNDQINEATRVQAEQRRWPAKDVTNYKVNAQKLEQGTGWKLLTAEEETEEPNDLGVALTLSYRDQLRLFFYPSAFQPKSDGRRRSGRKSRSVSGPTAPIGLTYSPDEDDDRQPKELSTELRFFLQLIQSQLHAFTMMPKGSVTCQTVLKTVSEGWALAQEVSSEIKQLNSAGVVHVSVVNDEKLGAKLMLMQPDRSRIDIEFVLSILPLNDGEISASTTVSATPIYGTTCTIMDASKTRKVQAALSKEVESKTLGEGSWLSAVRGFEEWLQAQVQAKQQEALKPKPTAKPQPRPASQEQPVAPPKSEPRRAATASPRQTQKSTTPKHPPRSPLAPKTTNSKIQKKALPVPKKPVQLTSSQQESMSMLPQPTNFRESQIQPSQQKENFVPVTAKSMVNGNSNGDGNGAEVTVVNENMGFDDVFAGAKPAIPPEMQEAMMYTPVKKRMGALRRSPV
ncbi:hypothetical protein PMZ80_004095 [Knufia obscura]|uniref:Spc7 kinetochore protein domain-containing protein n=1 Tax=Knufia obscura TaxID=1635080 RepID=A0ABR0RR43_9EURO|nr:hypothetical protein PMZ80_004095 [Knufia obscura]